MKNAIFLIITIISISLLSCKKDAAVKPVAVQPPAVKVVASVTQPYDYQKAILVKRTIITNR